MTTQSRTIKNTSVDMFCQTAENKTTKQVQYCNQYYEKVEQEKSSNIMVGVFVISFFIAFFIGLYFDKRLGSTIDYSWLIGGPFLLALIITSLIGCVP